MSGTFQDKLHVLLPILYLMYVQLKGLQERIIKGCFFIEVSYPASLYL